MKKVLILLVMSSVGYLCAGVLPADFHFKNADGGRTSFMHQFREYEEEQLIDDPQFQYELYVGEQLPDQVSQLLQFDEKNKNIDQFIERIKLMIAQVYRTLSMKK